MRGLVAMNPEGVEFRNDDARDGVFERRSVELVVQIGLEDRFRQACSRPDVLDDLFSEGAELDGGARWVGVDILLGEPAEQGELLPVRAQKLEVR